MTAGWLNHSWLGHPRIDQAAVQSTVTVLNLAEVIAIGASGADAPICSGAPDRQGFSKSRDSLRSHRGGVV
jgi:hypothetical protein